MVDPRHANDFNSLNDKIFIHLAQDLMRRRVPFWLADASDGPGGLTQFLIT